MNFYITVLIVTIISVYHYHIHSGIINTYKQTRTDVQVIKSEKCDDYGKWLLRCVSSSSSFMEALTIFCLLVSNGWTSVSVVLVAMLLRLASGCSVAATLTGILYGVLYSLGYKMSLMFFIPIVVVGVLLLIASVNHIDTILSQGYPDWVDESMIPSMKRKQQVPLTVKITDLLWNVCCRGITLLTWSKLEDYLEKLTLHLSMTGIQWDGVVGIKTGGAIISDYISKRLNVPNYKIKLSKSKYQCNKKPHDLLSDISDFVLHRNLNEVAYDICEPIQSDLKGKNLILIDETMDTGRTILRAYQYLMQEKNSSLVYPVCVTASPLSEMKLAVTHVESLCVAVWPWGYDN
jgi:hypoxanthine phosphoribosyltransferase